jgi:hypothetical protein
MSKLFRDLDFGTGSEAGYRIAIGNTIVQFNLDHNGLLHLPRTSLTKMRCPTTCMSRASSEMSRQNKPSRTATPLKTFGVANAV